MSDSPGEQRKHERFLVESAHISITIRPHGKKDETWGVVTNISSSGFQISLPLELAADTKIDIIITKRVSHDVIETEEVTGLVCWCKPDTFLEETFHIGVEIDTPL